VPELANKSVIITGAGRGIGRAVAIHLAACGACVVVNDVDANTVQSVVDKIVGAGGQALAMPGSVTDWQFAGQLVESAVSTFGRLDSLINNAGLHYERLAWQDDEASMRQLVEVNVLGSMYCATQALKVLTAQGFGSLINVTSGAHLGVARQSAYSATKGAIASLTYGLAIDAKAHGVRVNAVAPLARTRMTDALEHYQNKAAGPDVLPAEALAPLFGFLVSDRSAAITGQLIRFNGQDLSLIHHPAVSEVYETRPSWSIDSIDQVFRGSLRAQLNSVGLNQNKK